MHVRRHHSATQLSTQHHHAAALLQPSPHPVPQQQCLRQPVHRRQRHVQRTAAQESRQQPGGGTSPFSSRATAPTAATTSSTSSWQQAAGVSAHRWQWNGHSIHYVTAGCGRPVLLVHGFGASCGHYRRTIPFLAQAGLKVYAIDLLGFGASDKPVQQYTIETWAAVIVDFLAEFCSGAPAVVVGNSIGSLSCLAAAAAAAPEQLAGLVLLNSAGAMNNKGVVNDWRIVAAWPLLMLIDLLLRTPPIARALFNALAQPDTIRKVLGGVYVDKDAVDDELVDLILRPAFTDNALDVFVSVITGPAGPKPWDLLPHISCPLLVAWGDADPFTPLDGPVGQWFLQQATSRPDTEFVLLEGVGHCPMDDNPEALHKELLPWLQRQFAAASSSSSSPAASAPAS